MTTAPPHPATAATTTWHLAGSLVALVAAVDAHWPGRDKRSDGGIGDARHQAEGSASDHNPWLNHTVRAYDFTATQPGIDGVDGGWLAEQLRQLGLSGDVRLAGKTADDNGYVIWDHHITSPDWTRWVPYSGSDPHTSHVHVSVTRNPGGYEYAGPWDFLARTPLHPPAPTPAPQPAPAPHQLPDHGPGPHVGNDAAEAPAAPPPPDHPEPGFPPPGQDAVGHGGGFRAQYGDEGFHVRSLQDFLNRYAPMYSHLVADGVYGVETAGVIADFAHRIADGDPHCPPEDRDGLHNADGYTVGPRIAKALARVGADL